MPFSARGIAFAWISVSSTKWQDLRPALVKSDRGRSVKFLYEVFGSYLQLAAFFGGYIMIDAEVHKKFASVLP